jgi:ESS family glutamate:Na+ symporter
MLSLNPVQTVAAGALSLLLGRALVRLIPWASRYNLPAPVMGGLVVSLVLALLRATGSPSPISFDTTLQVPLMVAFFASIGFGASMADLKRGGPQVMAYLAACTVLLLLQNGIGIAFAKLVGQHPLFGVLVGSTTLAGGPGTALAFSESFERSGLTGAAPLGLAAAMGGILLGGLIGGPLSTFLIERHKLKPMPELATRGSHPRDPVTSLAFKLEDSLFRHVVLLLLLIWAGTYLSQLIQKAGVNLPVYVGAMLLAALVRNVNDAKRWVRLDSNWVDGLGNIALELFLSVAMMSLELWRLAEVAGPLALLLLIQVGFIAIVSVTVMFRFSGKDYDAAVMTGGLVGFMLGTTANAMANMDSVTHRYGPAHRAYLIVPLVGACFIDFTNAAVISWLLNVFKTI